MHDFLLSHYGWLMAFHLVAVISWMAGMLYLPRLFVYHAGTAKGSETSETFKIMERRLLRMIMTPAMLAVFLFGILMLVANPALMQAPWLHAKLGLVLMMAGCHGFFAVCVKKFARDENTRPAKFYRLINEAPALLMVGIVILVILKPL